RLEKIWQVAQKISPEVDQTLSAHPPLLRQVLFNRQHTTPEAARRYLGALPPDGNDPMRMAGMGAAVERIAHAIRNAEPIVVYGDYDADGVTATALLVQAL